MAESREQFIDDVINAHDELIDVAEELEALLLEVPELGFEPAVISSLNSRVNDILQSIDDAHANLFDLKLYLEGFDQVTPEAGGNTDPAGNVANTIAEPAHVSQPVPAEDNLISKPEVKSGVDTDGNVSPLVTHNGDHTSDDATQSVLVDKEDAANSIPGPVQQEGVDVAQEERFAPDQYPSTDQAGDISVTQKPEAEPVRPDVDSKDAVKDEGKSVSQIDVTSPNPAGVQSPDPEVAKPDEGSVRNPDAQQREEGPQTLQLQGDPPETDEHK